MQRYDRALFDERPLSIDDLPIYELDPEEALEHEAADAALSPPAPHAEYRPPMEPPQQPIAAAVAAREPAPPPDQPAPDPEPGIPVEEPSIPAPPEQPPDIEPAAREAVVLYGRIDRPSLAYFDRLFGGTKAPSLLNHFILGGALACTRSLEGGDAAGLKQHLDAQGQLLQRIVLHEKMGKKEPIAEYAGSMLARVDQFIPAPVPQTRARRKMRTSLLLEAELEAPTLGVLRKMQEESGRWDFTKARQLTLALQARRVGAKARRGEHSSSRRGAAIVRANGGDAVAAFLRADAHRPYDRPVVRARRDPRHRGALPHRSAHRAILGATSSGRARRGSSAAGAS